jgi:glutaredoxin
MNPMRHHLLPAATAIGVLLLAQALPAAAQYKVVQPDGSVTYTDRPPATGSARVTPMGRNAAQGSPEAALPSELRQAMSRYPVVLFAATDCAPCDAGRRLLQQRGIPYTERRVATEEDTTALERLVGGRSVPALTIGAQPLRGFSESDWGTFLDVAGYPRESKLPRNWPLPEATPLTERAAAGKAAAAPATPTTAAEPRAVEVTPQGGVRF